MTLEEIINKDGLYRADSFKKGFCFKVEAGRLYSLNYQDSEDFNPKQQLVFCFKGLFTKDYKTVYTRQSLFRLK